MKRKAFKEFITANKRARDANSPQQRTRHLRNPESRVLHDLADGRAGWSSLAAS
jgi:hypothetical protein